MLAETVNLSFLADLHFLPRLSTQTDKGGLHRLLLVHNAVVDARPMVSESHFQPQLHLPAAPLLNPESESLIYKNCCNHLILR